MTYSPWADARERHPDIHIEKWDIAPARGVWVASERVILLDKRLTRVERRCTLAHEIAHIDLGHGEARGWFARRMERDANRVAARRLLRSLSDLADALCLYPHHLGAVAEHLGVTVAVLRVRLENLTRAEERYIATRVAALEVAH